MKIAVKYTVDVLDTDRHGIALSQGITGRLATRQEVAEFFARYGTLGLGDARAARNNYLASPEHRALVAQLTTP